MCAMAWVAAHASEYHIAPDRMLVAGNRRARGWRCRWLTAWRTERSRRAAEARCRSRRRCSRCIRRTISRWPGISNTGIGPVGARALNTAYIGGSPQQFPERYRARFGGVSRAAGPAADADRGGRARSSGAVRGTSGDGDEFRIWRACRTCWWPCRTAITPTMLRGAAWERRSRGKRSRISWRSICRRVRPANHRASIKMRATAGAASSAPTRKTNLGGVIPSEAVSQADEGSLSPRHARRNAWRCVTRREIPPATAGRQAPVGRSG